MFRSLIFGLFLVLPLALAAEGKEIRILVVTGTSGTDKFESVFAENALKWKEAAELGNAAFELIGQDGEPGENEPSDADQLKAALAAASEPELWLVLIGHGSFDTREVKFNLRGPDVTDREIAKWVQEYPGKLTVINTASASGSFVRQLSGKDRVVITATKNEAEIFYTRFGNYFAEAVQGKKSADLDNDDQVSLLEAFIFASDEVATFYDNEGRLATEHALIDDNADGLGSRAEWYEGTTPTRTPAKDKESDGELASQRVLVKNEFEKRLTPEQRAQRDEWERAVRALRRAKDDMEEEAYYEQLEELLLKLGTLYREVTDS